MSKVGFISSRRDWYSILQSAHRDNHTVQYLAKTYKVTGEFVRRASDRHKIPIRELIRA